MAEKKTRTPKEPKEVKEKVVAQPVEEVQERPQRAPRAQGSSPEGHFVYIGKKGAMAYVLAVITQFGEGADKVIIKARGKSISRAVDVAEIVRNKSDEVKLTSIGISTEEVTTEDGRPLKVSAIEIVLSR